MPIGASQDAPAPPASEGDVYAGTIEHRIPGASVKELSRIRPIRAIGHIAAEWALIAAAAALAVWSGHWAAYLPAVVLIGARQHALGVMLHDGAHWRLVRDRRLNDMISDAFLAWPLFITTKAYRTIHFAHHRHTNTDRDPDWTSKQTAEWRFPKSRWELAKLLLLDVSGLQAHRQLTDLVLPLNLPTGSGPEELRYGAARAAYYLGLAALLTATGQWLNFALLWLVPYFTWLKLSLRIRSIAEHFAVPYDHTLTQTRTTYPNAVERLLLAPKHVNYHLDHHLYPSVPFYALPDLHRALLKQPGFAETAHLTHSYRGVLAECIGQPPRRAAAGEVPL